MQEKRVRWGILGAAKIAREWLCPAIHMSKAGTIEAIASRTAGKAEDLARPYGDVRIFDDYEAMLGDADIDAIYVPLPNADHVEWTMKCLEAGKHVLCEKPIALKVEEIDTLIIRANPHLTRIEISIVVFARAIRSNTELQY